MIRTHEAGTLSASQIGTTVRLAGWVDARRDHGGVVFVDLRDASGIVQCVIREELVDELGAHKLRNEFCVAVCGVVEARSADTVNPNMATGQIEVAVSSLEVLSPAAPLPFPIDDRVNVGEDTRFRHRYLDLRRPEPGRLLQRFPQGTWRDVRGTRASGGQDVRQVALRCTADLVAGS